MEWKIVKVKALLFSHFLKVPNQVYYVPRAEYVVALNSSA